MNNKPQKSWGEIQLAIAAVGLAATMVFWNLFSTPQKQVVVASPTDTTMPPPQDPTQEPTQVSTQPAALAFVPVKIIFGGTAPQQPQVVVQSASSPAQPKHRGGGGGGGGGSKPPASTGSSKP